MSVSTSVYRCYGVGRELLYVGCSGNVNARIRQHRSQSDWASSMIHHSVRVYSSREVALTVERRAISLLKPKHNKLFHPDWTNPWHVLLAEDALIQKEGE